VVAESGKDEKTEFAELTMSGVFNEGVLSSDDLLMLSPLLRATGEGTVNLVEESIDFVLKPVLTGEAGEALGKLNGVAIPVKLSGNMYEPGIRVDIVAALAESQKEVITKKADEYIGGLLGSKKESGAEGEEGEGEETSDAASSLLKGLLGGKKKKGEKEDDGGGAE
jgi:AsmA protein